MSAEPLPAEERVLNGEEAAIDNAVRNTPLPSAVLAVFTGRIGRRWTLGEIQRKLQALGFRLSRNSLVVAMGELEAQLEDNDFLPWILIERGQEWFLTPKNEVLAALEGVPSLRLNRSLSEEEKAVLIVVIGYRRKGGVSATRIGKVMPLGETTIKETLSALEKEGLIYSDPESYYSSWRPRAAAHLYLGLRAHTEIPELKELELYFDSLASSQLERAMEIAGPAAKRHANRRIAQSITLPEEERGSPS